MATKSVDQEFVDVLCKAVEVENDPNARTAEELAERLGLSLTVTKDRIKLALKLKTLKVGQRRVLDDQGRIKNVVVYKVVKPDDQEESPKSPAKKK